MATLVINCPECDKAIKVPAEAVGKKVRCKNCEHVFVIKAPVARDAIAPAGKKEPSAPAKPAKGAKPDKAIKPQQPAKPAKPAKPTDDDDDDGPPGGYGMTDDEVDARCPQCAAKMQSEVAIICLRCGYNKVSRELVRTRKIKETTGGDKFLWLLPGILCVLLVLVLIGYCVFHHFALPGIVIANWDELTATKSRMEALKDDSVGFLQAALIHPAVEIWIFVFMAFCTGRPVALPSSD